MYPTKSCSAILSNLNHCKMSKNTGVALSEIKGPLTNLLNNLSGEHGYYWLSSLKKMLRKENLPERPTEIVQSLNPLRVSAREKLEKLAEYLRSIPVIHEVTICDIDEEGDLLNISVLPNLRFFIEGTVGEGFDSPLFWLKSDHTVQKGKTTEMDCTDKIFDNFCKQDQYENIIEFCNAMIELGNRYEASVPKVS